MVLPPCFLSMFVFTCGWTIICSINCYFPLSRILFSQTASGHYRNKSCGLQELTQQPSDPQWEQLAFLFLCSGTVQKTGQLPAAWDILILPYIALLLSNYELANPILCVQSFTSLLIPSVCVPHFPVFSSTSVTGNHRIWVTEVCRWY